MKHNISQYKVGAKVRALKSDYSGECIKKGDIGVIKHIPNNNDKDNKYITISFPNLIKFKLYRFGLSETSNKINEMWFEFLPTKKKIG